MVDRPEKSRGCTVMADIVVLFQNVILAMTMLLTSEGDMRCWFGMKAV